MWQRLTARAKHILKHDPPFGRLAAAAANRGVCSTFDRQSCAGPSIDRKGPADQRLQLLSNFFLFLKRFVASSGASCAAGCDVEFVMFAWACDCGGQLHSHFLR